MDPHCLARSSFSCASGDPAGRRRLGFDALWRRRHSEPPATVGLRHTGMPPPVVIACRHLHGSLEPRRATTPWSHIQARRGFTTLDSRPGGGRVAREMETWHRVWTLRSRWRGILGELWLANLMMWGFKC
jgi:hypothetical protein